VQYEAAITTPAASYAYGLGTTIARAGSESSVILQAMWETILQCNGKCSIDPAGHVTGIYKNRTSGGAEVTLTFRYGDPPRPENETIHQKAIDLKDGRYYMTYVPKFVGIHSLDIKVFGVHTQGSPFTIAVKEAEPDAKFCYAYDTVKLDQSKIGGLAGGQAGKQYKFIIECTDEFGNKLKSKSKWTKATTTDPTQTEAFMVKFVTALDQNKLYWGRVVDKQDGKFEVEFSIPVGAEYYTHIHLKQTETTYVSIKGSPFSTLIRKIKCPVIGDPEPCNGQGICQDTGVCECYPGWDGDYCQNDLAKWLRIIIVVENALIACLVLMGAFKIVWDRYVIQKQMFERLQHDDTEEDW